MLLFKVTFNFSPPSTFFLKTLFCLWPKRTEQRGEAIFVPWLKLSENSS